MEADQNIWGIVAPIVGVVVAVLTMTRFVVSGIEYLLSLPDRIRRYYFRPKFILIPTAEEMAKYSAQEPDVKEIDIREYYEELSISYAKQYFRWRQKSQMAVLTVGLYMLFGYLGIFLHIFFIRFRGEKNASILGPLDTGFGLLNGYIAITIIVFLLLFAAIVLLLARFKLAPIISALKNNF